jgi:flagellar protein FlaG
MTAPNAQEGEEHEHSVSRRKQQPIRASRPDRFGRALHGRQTPKPARLQTPQDAAQADKAAPPSSEELNQAVKQIQDVITKTANRLEFSIDEDLGVSIVKVVDTESKKLIRQIPSEEVLKIAKALDTLQGLLVKQQA